LKRKAFNWIKFSIIYSIVTCKTPSEEIIRTYFCKAQEWINLFVKLGDKWFGYTTSKVTPYMHAMIYHVLTFLKTYRTVKIFSGQGVQKTMMSQEE
jgi:hypothetical protein